MIHVPLENTILYRLIHKKRWAKLCLLLHDSFSRNVYKVTSAYVEDVTLSIGDPETYISQSHASNMLVHLSKMKLIERQQQGGRDTFIITEKLFYEKDKMIRVCNQTVNKKR